MTINKIGGEGGEIKMSWWRNLEKQANSNIDDLGQKKELSNIFS